jgi:hypothetical protein
MSLSRKKNTRKWQFYRGPMDASEGITLGIVHLVWENLRVIGMVVAFPMQEVFLALFRHILEKALRTSPLWSSLPSVI